MEAVKNNKNGKGETPMSHTSIALSANHSLSRTSRKMPSCMFGWQIWIMGILAAGISGGANGVITGFTAMGIDSVHFNMQGEIHNTLMIAGVSAMMSSIIGVAAYLKQSPLPKEQ
jgi:hypothetical protein